MLDILWVNARQMMLSQQEYYEFTSTLFIGFGTVGKEVFVSEVDTVTVKVMRLKEPWPEFLLSHLVRNVLIMLLSYCTCTEQHHDFLTNIHYTAQSSTLQLYVIQTSSSGIGPRYRQHTVILIENDNVNGTVIVALPLREFTRFIWKMRNSVHYV